MPIDILTYSSFSQAAADLQKHSMTRIILMRADATGDVPHVVAALIRFPQCGVIVLGSVDKGR